MQTASAARNPSRRASSRPRSNQSSAARPVHRDLEIAEKLHGPPLGVSVAELGGDQAALLGARDPARKRPAAHVDRRRGEQRFSAEGGALRRRLERRGEAAVRLLELDAAQPERRERDAEPERVARLPGEQRGERRAQVRRLGIEPLRVPLTLRELERPHRVPAGQGGGLAGVGEPLARVQPDRLEQPVAPLASAFVRGDERLLDEAREHVGALRDIEAGSAAHGLDRVQLEAAGEDAESAQQHPLVRLEQIVAPLERRLERLLPRRRRATPGAEEPETVIEPVGHRGGTERAEPAGGELEREWQAVEPEADTRDIGRVLLVERESRCCRRRALDEQPHRLVVEEIGRREVLLGVGDREGRHAEHDLAADAERLAARREHGQSRRGTEDRVDERGARPEQVLAVVQDEQQRARREVLEHRVDDVLSRQRPRVERRRDSVGHELRIGDGRELDERRASLVRRLGAARELQREPRLAGAAGPRERQQARVPEQRAQLAELAPAADERARIGRQRSRPVTGVERGELVGELRTKVRELVPAVDRPVVVAVLRKQLAAVHRERGAVRGRRPGAARIGRGRLEPDDVDVGHEEQHLVAKLDRTGVERAARDVHRLVEVVRRRRRPAVAPEHVHHLLAVQPAVGSEREQLHELARLLQPPGLLRHRLAVDGGREAAQKRDRDAYHPPRGCPKQPSWGRASEEIRPSRERIIRLWATSKTRPRSATWSRTGWSGAMPATGSGSARSGTTTAG